MKTRTKVVITAGSIFVGSMLVYVTKECIKEYNSVIEENDKLKEYIAKELIAKDCNVDMTLSNGKHLFNEVKEKVALQAVKSYEENNVEVTEYNNGFKVLKYKGA